MTHGDVFTPSRPAGSDRLGRDLSWEGGIAFACAAWPVAASTHDLQRPEAACIAEPDSAR